MKYNIENEKKLVYDNSNFVCEDEELEIADGQVMNAPGFVYKIWIKLKKGKTLEQFINTYKTEKSKSEYKYAPVKAEHDLIEDEGYYLIYIGSAYNLHGRINTHLKTPTNKSTYAIYLKSFEGLIEKVKVTYSITYKPGEEEAKLHAKNKLLLGNNNKKI